MRKTGVPESGNQKNRERRINKKAVRRTGILAVVLILLFSAAALPALTIKLGSVAPAGSPWDKGLKQMAAEWHEISGGRINVKIYPGGIVGTEPDMIRKMRIGQLQAAVFTSLGMNSISPDVMALSIPFLIRNDAELDYLLEKITPELNERMERSGFTVIAWAPAGWATVFAKEPVVYPRDLQQLSFAFPATDSAIFQAWKNLGFRVLAISAPELMTALQSGMVEAFMNSPLIAASFQWFGVANHMTDLKVAPLLGGLVVSNRTWRRIPPKMREELLESARDILDPIYAKTKDLEEEAIEIMLDNGLVIHDAPEDAVKRWREVTGSGFEYLVGRTFSEEFYEKIQQYLEEYRR